MLYVFECMVATLGGYRWLAAGTIIPNSLYRVAFFYLFLIRALCYCYLLFVFVSFLCFRWSSVDVPLIFSCSADHVVPDWQPRILLGMVEARSVKI